MKKSGTFISGPQRETSCELLPSIYPVTSNKRNHILLTRDSLQLFLFESTQIQMSSSPGAKQTALERVNTPESE